MNYLRKTWASALKHKRYVFPAVAVLVAVVGYALFSGNDAPPEAEAGPRVVETLAVSEFSRGAGGLAVPTANGDSYVVRAEAGGRVTRIGRTGAVAQGTLIAQLENSSQQAALTQAQGAYEAAVAAAGGNETSQASARQDAVRTWTSATVEAAETLRTAVDGYYATVRSTQGATGFKLEAFGAATDFNAERGSIETNILDRWESENVTESNAAEKLAQLNADLATIGGHIDRIAALIPRQSITAVYSEAARAADAASLAAARAAITTQQEQVDAARTAITSASGSGDASAQAQVKQALGSLQAARATYEKTLIRTPFSGTVSSLNVKVGDVISTGGDVAIIIPEEGVETERSFALPLSAVKYTPNGAFVFVVSADGILESRAVETGLVTADSISVSGLNGDEVIVRDVRGLKAGEQVSVAE